MRCTAIKMDGKRCTMEAMLGTLCTKHFRQSLIEEGETVEV